jgi:hypothetical protein
VSAKKINPRNDEAEAEPESLAAVYKIQMKKIDLEIESLLKTLRKKMGKPRPK